MSRPAPPSISFRGVTRRCGAVLANDDIGFDVAPGSIHVLLGENGAGKTTLLSILSGFLRADSGEIRIDGVALRQGSPAESLRRGVGLCAQHFLLAGALTGAENILLGRPGARGWRRPSAEAIARARGVARAHGMAVALDVSVADLTIADQERIEILKLLERDCRILVLDEPTSVLAPPEVGPLFATLRELARSGRTILLVTHRLAEVMEIADRVTVLRKGRVVGSAARSEVNPEMLVRWIAGREDAAPLAHPPARTGAVVLSCSGLSSGRGPSAPSGIDLDVREGEIVGLGGVLGNGQTELVQAITGQIPLAAGSVMILGRSHEAPARVRLPDSVAWIPEDRRGEGIALEMTAEENMRLGLPRSALPTREEILRRLREFDVRPPEPGVVAARLSGGNQQRLLLARELARKTRLLLAVHPTRGLDPGATAFVRAKLLEARSEGTGILLVTGDRDELQELSDRLFILFRGRTVYATSRDLVDGRRMDEAMVGLLR